MSSHVVSLQLVLRLMVILNRLAKNLRQEGPSLNAFATSVE